ILREGILDAQRFSLFNCGCTAVTTGILIRILLSSLMPWALALSIVAVWGCDTAVYFFCCEQSADIDQRRPSR
ncbi:hypothetical protein C8F01DRAFT_1169719, partial [Mycena amicta]